MMNTMEYIIPRILYNKGACVSTHKMMKITAKIMHFDEIKGLYRKRLTFSAIKTQNFFTYFSKSDFLARTRRRKSARGLKGYKG